MGGDSRMNRISNFVIKYSKLIIVTVIVITFILGYYATQIKIKAGIEDMLPKGNAVVDTFYKATDLFGGMNYGVIMIEDQDLLDTHSLKKIDEITKELEKVEVVKEVTSLANIQVIKGDYFGIEVKKLIDSFPQTNEETQNLKKEISNEEQYIGSIISEDFTSTLILINFIPEMEKVEKSLDEIRKIVNSYEDPEKMYYTGNPFLVSDASSSMKRDLSKLFPIVVAIVIIILWLSFRSVSGVLLPISTVLISVIWAIGALSLFGKSLSIISVVLPVLLVSVGSAYAIHIVTRYYEELEAGYNIQEAIANTIKKVGIGVVMAGITTMVGFGSLLFSDLIIIKEFAFGAAFGVGIALLISVLFIPAIYLHLPRPKFQKVMEGERSSDHLFKVIFQLVINYRPLIISLILFLVIGSIFVIPKLRTETGYLNYFQKGSETRVAAELVDQRFGGSSTLDVVIYSDIKNPELLVKMKSFQGEVEKIDGLNSPISMVTIFEEENKALNGGDDLEKKIPTDTKQIAQYLLLLSMSGQDVTKNYLSFDESITRIQFRIENIPSARMEEVIQQVEELIDIHLGKTYEIDLTGVPVMMTEVSKIIINSQIKSIIATILLTMLVTSILLKSIRRGLFCSITIALTVLLNFGIMGWFDLPLDIATAMIASIAVGIGVDYSIHIYTRYLEEKETQESDFISLNTAIYTVGRANLYNALAVVAGFCVILFSAFPPLVNFGGLTAVIMVLSFMGAMLILPTLILSTRKLAQKVKDMMVFVSSNK